MKREMILLLVILLLIPAVSLLSQSGADEDQKNQYLNLPVDLHAQSAMVKLDRALEEAKRAGNQDKLQLLRQAHQWLTTAIAKYDEYNSGPTQTTRPIDPAAGMSKKPFLCRWLPIRMTHNPMNISAGRSPENGRNIRI